MVPGNKKMQKVFTLLLTLFTVSLFFGGCYTVLIHPETEEGYTSRDYQDACVDCHSDYNEYPYGYFYGEYYPDYWWSTPRYGHYYAYPWWWDYYWSPSEGYYAEDDNDSDDFVPRTSSGAKVSRRGGSLIPPYVNSSGYNGNSVPNITRGADGMSRGTTGTSSKEIDNNGTDNDSGSSTEAKDTRQNQSGAKQQETETKAKKGRRGGGRN